jgi:hypothetical protein
MDASGVPGLRMDGCAVTYVALVLRCQKVNCEEAALIDVGYRREVVGELIDEYAPGWGWDTLKSGDDVMHCPDHRG